MNNVINIILQGKGGVGKSLIASLLAQYFSGKKLNLYCADTDPVNDTFARYKTLNVETIQIVDAANKIDTRAFDALVEHLTSHEGPAVIDNGASTFVPLTSYLIDSNIMEIFADANRDVVLHAVLTGGQALQDTLVGLKALLGTQKAPVVVLVNEYFGKVVAKDGSDFANSELYKRYKDRILGVVTIPQRSADTYGKDMELLVSNTLTFEQAKTSDIFTFMPRSRLARVQKDIYDQIDALNLCEQPVALDA